MMTTALRHALRHDRDRRRIELLGVRQAALLASRARRASIVAMLKGENPVAAMRNVLAGDPRINPEGFAALIRDGMVAGHLAGKRRTVLTASAKFRVGDGYKLAGTVYDETIEFLQTRLQTPEYVLVELKAQYGQAAVQATERIVSSLETRVQRLLIDLTREGAGVREGIKALKQAYMDEGITPEANYRLEATFRTQTQLAYSAGREATFNDPDIADILWGFEYVAIDDDRTTPLCRELNGVIRPKDDPFWDQFTPPNHWNCRSAKVEIFDEGTATEIPNVQPIPGFGFNPGEVFREPAFA